MNRGSSNEKALTKKYKNFYSVQKLKYFCKRRKYMQFLDQNGAGKSTTLKMLLGLVQPTEGEIEIFGKYFYNKNRIEI